MAKPSELEHTELDSFVKKWLLNDESLTARLIKKSSGSFYVNVLKQNGLSSKYLKVKCSQYHLIKNA